MEMSVKNKSGVDLKMCEGSYLGKKSLINPIKYIMNPEKQKLSGAIGSHPSNAEEMIFQFEKVKKIYNKNNGRMLKHFIISVSDDIKMSPEEMLEYAEEIATFYGDKYQIVYAVHENTQRLHTHFIFNTVSFLNGKKYSSEWDELYNLRNYVKNVYRNQLDVQISDSENE